MTAPPRAAGRLGAAGGLAVMCWKGLDQNNIWVSTSEDGLNWSPQKELNDRSTKSGPTVAGTVGGPRKFVMAWAGWIRTTSGSRTRKTASTWSSQVELNDRAICAT